MIASIRLSHIKAYQIKSNPLNLSLFLPCVFVNQRYQSESAELSHWLQSALDRLEFWTTQSVTVPQELETVRDHLYAFLVS